VEVMYNPGRRAKSRPTLVAALLSVAFTAWSQISPCDLNGDGVTDASDVTAAVNMALGTATCTANVEGRATCALVTVQRVINASQGKTCVTYNSPSITSAMWANGTVGSPFSYQVAATNSPTRYDATGLPAGVSINAATGLIAGTPTSVGTSIVTLAATGGGIGNATLTLVVATAGPAVGTSPSMSMPATHPSSAAVARPAITSATSATGAVGMDFFIR
jgi:hypothetical protein